MGSVHLSIFIKGKKTGGRLRKVTERCESEGWTPLFSGFLMWVLTSLGRGLESRLGLQGWLIFPLVSSQARRSTEVVNKCTLKPSQLTLFTWTWLRGNYRSSQSARLVCAHRGGGVRKTKRTRQGTIWAMGARECRDALPSLPLWQMACFSLLPKMDLCHILLRAGSIPQWESRVRAGGSI